MKLKNIIAIGLFILSSSSPLAAQYYSFSQLIKQADAAYEAAHFIKAIDFYQQAMELTSDYSPEVLFRLGDAAFQAQSLGISEMALSSYLEREDIPLASEAIFRLARIAHQKGNYEMANRQYELYLSEYSEVNMDMTKAIDSYKSSAEWAINSDIQNEIDTVIRLDDKINTPASDNAPFFHDGSLYYSSLNYPIAKDKYHRHKSHILKDAEILTIPGITEEQLVSNPTFTKDGKTMYFSICNYEQVYSIRCEIHKADVLPDGSIANVTKLPASINQSGTTTSHPAIAETDQGTTLFFSSNRLGGKGGIDIWEASMNEYGWGEPANVFALNTPFDEVTPFYHNPTKKLYFSSNGHKGYGGHDIFRYSDGQQEPENMGMKLNSSYDDIHYSLKEDGSKGYLSSKRPGSSYADKALETCCFDIYESKVRGCNIDLKTLAYDQETKEPLNGVKVKIYDKTTGEVFYDQVPATHEAQLNLPCEGDWQLTATREDYNPLELDLSNLNGIYGTENTTIKELYLNKDYSEVLLNLEVFEEVAKKPVIGATVYLTDLSDNTQASIETNKNHIFAFTLKSDREYLLEINKAGFKEKTIKFNSGYGQLQLNKEAILDYLDVVQKSMVSLENAIPVTLYFDNDSPDPNTTNTSSSMTYTETFDAYFSKKDKFKNQYLSLFSSSDMITANDEMENLFHGHIKRGFDRYDVFKKQLLIVLESGQDINIYLKGYASPIAQSDYNAALGKRRVDSIRKEFDSWNNGALLKYIQSGQLKVTERSFGETTSPEGISDDPSAPSKSIFSPQASLERRVEIEEINFNEQ